MNKIELIEMECAKVADKIWPNRTTMTGEMMIQ
jgi:hypothetical protein